MSSLFRYSDSMFLIRQALDEDASAIARVHVESWQTTYRGIVPDQYLESLNVEERTARWQDLLRSGSRVFVAEGEGRIIGFVHGGAIREPLNNYDAELFAIYLLAEAQGRGIGTAILMELVKALNEDGFQSIAVWVLEANAAVRFYEALGAVRVATTQIEIGGTRLPLIAYAWSSLQAFLA